MQMLQTLSLWTPVCPVRTAAPGRETPSARSVLLLINLRLPGIELYETIESQPSVCLYVDLRGVWRGFGGV